MPAVAPASQGGRGDRPLFWESAAVVAIGCPIGGGNG